MPTDRDLVKIEKMIDEVGDVERKLGVIDDDSYLERAEVKGEETEDLNELLEDIELGIKEERELESKVLAKQGETEKEVTEEIEEEKIDLTKKPAEEKMAPTGEDSGEKETKGQHIEEIGEIEEEKEKLEEETEENAEISGQEQKVSEEENLIAEEEIEKKEEITEEELQDEISKLEGAEGAEEETGGEEILDLPEDFDIEKLNPKEEPPVGFFKSEKEKEAKQQPEEEARAPEEVLTKELEGIMEGIEEEGEEEIPEFLEEEGEKEIVETPEEGLGEELEELIEEEAKGKKGEIEPEGPLEELTEKEIVIPEGTEARKGAEITREEEALETLDVGEGIEEEKGILDEELPEIEEIISEGEGIEEPPEIEEPSGIESVKETGEAETPEAGAPYEELQSSEVEEKGFELDLSDEDILLITTKLKQISPELAVAIRDSILQSKIPPEKLKGLLDLLIRDVPEEKIKQYYEEITGEKIIIERIPELIKVEKKPGPLAAVYENLAPTVRVTALGVIVVAILFSIFMLFFYRPIKANKYYKDGIIYLKSENYELAEQYFNKGQSIYSRIDEYDKYGWGYMLEGNYDKAMEKFKEGIKKDSKYKVLSLRLHLAKLYNILGQYKEADSLYSELVRRYPKRYEYIKLKGLNLIDWGKTDKEQLKKAYALFSEANKRFPKESDPVIRMMYISILFDNIKSVKSLYDYLNQNFPDSFDSFVHTSLASFFIDKAEFTMAKNLLMKLLARFPDYPPLYYAYAKYYKAIGSKKDQELMLNIAISKEESRKILYPWDSHDRNLLSKAYNDLGEIYANLDIPGKSAEAIRYFKRAIEEDPENKIAYFNLAQVYFYKEMDYELAERYYTEAKKRGFINKDLMYNLGVLYFYKRDFARAVNSWITLNEMMPGNPNVSFALACAFLHLKKYEAALGELINLSETYNMFIKDLGEIKPWKAYHKMILSNAASVYNNLGVTYEKLYEKTKNVEYQKKSLVSLYKAGELADIIGIDRGIIQYNINYILHPDVIRADMAISDNISTNYRFMRR